LDYFERFFVDLSCKVTVHDNQISKKYTYFFKKVKKKSVDFLYRVRPINTKQFVGEMAVEEGPSAE